MIGLQEHNGKLKVENYGLMEWATDVQSAVQQGYEIDTSNEGYPQNFGSLYTCLMVESIRNPYLEEIHYLRKELKELQEKTVNGLVLKVEAPDNGLMKYIPNDEQVLQGKQAGTPLVLPVDEVKDVLVGTIPKDSDSLIAPYVAQEATIVAEKETEVKRGPKPKNK